MISLANEHILSLSEAAKILPKRRAGKRPHVATLYRWSTRGLRGVMLEVIQVGATRCTSREALQRFFDSLSPSGALRESVSHSDRKDQIALAQRTLRNMK